MPKCVNDESKYYKGDEPSPKGLGYSASSEEEGTTMTGKDGANWIVSQTKTCKKWVKVNNEKKSDSKTESKAKKTTKPKKKVIDFDDLDGDCYIDSYVPNVSNDEIINETGCEEKFGGSKPFFIEGESWPLINNKQPMKLVCQFKDPRKKDNILYRIFSNIDESYDYDEDDDENDCFDDEEFKVLKIELNEENLKKQIVLDSPNFKTPYKGYEIKKWSCVSEFKSIYYILDKYGYSEEDKYGSIKIPDKYHTEYFESRYAPSPSIKIGGTPFYCQSIAPKNHKEAFLQLSESEFHPYGWGDAGVAHVNEEGRLYWDCY
jgi:hypothetical protein